MYKLCFKKAEEPEIKLPAFVGSWRKQGSSIKISTSASLTMLKPWTLWITTKCGKFLKTWEYQHNLLTSQRPDLKGWSDLGLGFQHRKCGGKQAFSPESLLLALAIILQAHSQLKVFALAVLSSWNTHIFTWWTCPWHSNLGSNVIILRTSSLPKNHS